MNEDLNMDPESPFVGRVERTFWTVWYYITGAVNRLLRPEPANANEQNSLQESAVDSEPAKVSHSEDEVNRRQVDEEQPLAPASRPAVAWDLGTTDIDLGPDVETMQYKSGKKDSVEDEDTRGEELKQTDCDDLGLPVVEDEKAKEHEEEDRKLCTQRQDETPEKDEDDQRVNTKSQMLKSDATSDDLVSSEGGREMKPNVPQKMEETETTIQDKVEDNEYDLDAEGIEMKSCTVTECSPNIHIEKEHMQKNETDTLMKHEEVENSQGALSRVQDEKQLSESEKCSKEELLIAYNRSNIVSEDELIVAGKEHVIAPRNMSNKSEDVKGKANKSTMEEREQEAVLDEENVDAAERKQALDEVLEQEDNSQTVPEDSNDIKSCSDEVLLSAKTELQTSEQEDVATEAHVQTKIRDTDDFSTKSFDTSITEQFIDEPSDFSVDKRSLDTDQVQDDIKECWEVRACKAISVTVQSEGETGQEESWEFQNIPQGIFEGRSDVTPELNPPTCEETQEGLPEYNNEPGPDENTTQRFLEVGDSKEVQTTQLPEEVESKEPESLQNSGRSTGADCLLVQEHMEEVQESKEPLVEPTAHEPGPSFVEDGGTSMVAPMKSWDEHSEKELETDLTKTEDLQDEKLLVETDEGSFDSKEADAAGEDFEATENLEGEETPKSLEAKEQMTMETRLQELVDAKKTEENSDRTSGVQDDIPDIGCVKQSVVTELVSNKEAELNDPGNNVELEVCKVEEEEEEAVEAQIQNKTEAEIFDLQVDCMEAEITMEDNDLISELMLAVKSVEAENQLPDTEATNELETIESKPEHDVCMISTDEVQKNMLESVGSSDEEMVCSISPSQDVIEEEILDMWMETLSKDDEKHQESPEFGPQMNPEIDPLKQEQTGEDTEQLVKSNSGESELVSDTEISSSTAESGFSDQSLNEWSPQNSEAQLLKSTSPGSVQDVHDMLVNVSESGSIFELSPQQHNSGSQDNLMEETPDARQLYLKDEESVSGCHQEERHSGEVRHLDEESDQTQEKTHEENGLQKEIDGEVKDLLDFKTTVEADVTSLTEVDALLQPEKTKVKPETLEISAFDSQEEIQHSESTRSRSDSEATSEEGILSSESGSQDDSSTQSVPEKKSLGLPEEIDDSLPGLTRTEVAEQLQTESEDQSEVDASVLDFSAQRSRIAVKNPRVRPPKDPRSLLHMPSVDPTPASCLPVKVPAGVPLGGIGIGIKLPGLGAGFPVLKKTKQMMTKESSPDSNPQEPETKPEEKSIVPEQDEAQHKPRWMPPRHPGIGNPLMSELKTKLKKTTKD